MYDPDLQFQLGGSVNEPEAFYNAIRYEQDCTKAMHDKESYEICAHYFPEKWGVDQRSIKKLVDDGVTEEAQPMGMIGYEGLFVPKFTAQQEPSFLSYFGMQGEENRRLLAETFLTPMTWSDYCLFVSPNECSVPDSVARRPPVVTNDEGHQFFVEGLYSGHFHKSFQNDCEINPNCTGHLASFPCGWRGYAEAQVYHLGIALKGGGTMNNGGYEYERLKEVLLAANATKSNLIIEWWRPEALDQLFRGTDTELVKVDMIFPSQACMSKRPSIEDLCDPDQQIRVGDADNVCENPVLFLSKLIGKGFYDSIYNAKVPEEIRSPAHEFLSTFIFNELNLHNAFQAWRVSGSPHEAICQFAVDNLESSLKPSLPRTHPRIIQEKSSTWLTYFSMALGALACFLVLLTSQQLFERRNHPVIKCAQIDFLWMLLCGSLCLGVGAIVAAAPSTVCVCVLEVWLVDVGYTLILIPIMVKVAAINKLMRASRKMRKVVIERKSLLGTTALVCGVTVVFLVIWTAIDPPQKTAEYSLTETQTDSGNTVVTVGYYCSSESNIWWAISVGWNVILLFGSSILAFQSRDIKQAFNESQTLTALVYVHFAIVLLRVVSFFVTPLVEEATLSYVMSILYSVDVIATVTIYFVPKIFVDQQHQKSNRNVFTHQGNAMTWKATTPACQGLFPFQGGPSSPPLQLTHIAQPIQSTPNCSGVQDINGFGDEEQSISREVEGCSAPVHESCTSNTTTFNSEAMVWDNETKIKVDKVREEFLANQAVSNESVQMLLDLLPLDFTRRGSRMLDS